MCFSFNPPMPIVSKETVGKFADACIELLEIVAGSNDENVVSNRS